MSSTDGPDIASTESMSSTYARVQTVTAAETSETSKIRGVLQLSGVLNPVILQHSSKILRIILETSNTSQYKTLKYCEYHCTRQY